MLGTADARGAKGIVHGTVDENGENDVLRGCSNVNVWARVSCDGCWCGANSTDDET